MIYFKTEYGPGTTFEWVFKYHGDLEIIVKVIGYDMVGDS
jgi:hypothetical protein